MPRYFFQVHDGDDFPDLQGTVLDDIDAARVEAVRFSGDLLRDGAEKFWSEEEWSMRVSDDKDLTLFELLFTAACCVSTSPKAPTYRCTARNGSTRSPDR